jgi:predicted RND superfamily exporter protein
MRQKLESIVSTLTLVIYKHPFISLILLVLILIYPISNVTKLTRDGSIEGFLEKDDVDLLAHNSFRRQFGQDSEIVIAIKSNNIYSISFLKRLKNLHIELVEEVPYIEDITSMLNARDSRGGDSFFKVENLLDNMPIDQSDLDELKQRVERNKLYENVLISKNGKLTTIRIKPIRFSVSSQNDGDDSQFINDFNNNYIEQQNSRTDFLTVEELQQMVTAVNEVTSKYNSEDFNIFISGAPVASGEIVKLMSEDMPTYTKLSIIIILSFLIIITRKITYVILPLSVIALTLLTTFGFMAISGTAIKPPTQVLLSIIIVAGLCGTIHILTVFYKQIKKGKDKKYAILYSIEHCGLAVIFTSITTAMGLLSFVSSPLAPISDLGIFGALSVIITLILTFFLTIIGIRLFYYKRTKKEKNIYQDKTKKLNIIKDDYVEKYITKLGIYSYRNPWLVIISALILTVISAGGIYQLKFSHNSLVWLPEDNKVRIDTAAIDKELSGSISMEVVIDTGVNYGIQNKPLLDNIDELTREIYSLQDDNIQIGKTLSVTDILREVNKTVHGSKQEYFNIPSQELISEEFLLFENSGSDDLSYYSDTLYSKARYTVKLPWLEASQYQQFIENTNDIFHKKLGNNVDVTPTGLMALLAKTSSGVMHSMSFSYLYSGIAILILMLLINRSIKKGVLSMIPNLLPIISVLGLMGYLKIPLDTFTIMVGSIALGLIVDDTIHFFHQFEKHYKDTNDIPLSITKTVNITGRPILITSLVLMIGFIMYTQSSMNNIQSFGIMMNVAVLFALFADVFVSPALVTLFHRKEMCIEPCRAV